MNESNRYKYNRDWKSTKQASLLFGVTTNTIRKWGDNNKLICKRKPSNQRVYYIPDKSDKQCRETEILRMDNTIPLKNFVYCRVSSYKQKEDLERQCAFMASKYPNFTIIKDIGSGLNYKRKGLLFILEESLNGRVKSVVVSSKDRLCRFGFELINWIFLQNNTKLVVLEQDDKTKEQEFTEDILAILQVFACRWNGKRKYKTINK